MKRVTYHFTEKQIERLNALNDATGLPVAEHVRRAIDEYLAKELKLEGQLRGAESTQD